MEEGGRLVQILYILPVDEVVACVTGEEREEDVDAHKECCHNAEKYYIV